MIRDFSPEELAEIRSRPPTFTDEEWTAMAEKARIDGEAFERSRDLSLRRQVVDARECVSGWWPTWLWP